MNSASAYQVNSIPNDAIGLFFEKLTYIFQNAYFIGNIEEDVIAEQADSFLVNLD